MYDAVAFDLLTALIDSWSLWNEVAGSEQAGMRWRTHYLRLTYGAGAYRRYEDIVAEAAHAADLDDGMSETLAARWLDLTPWPDTPFVLDTLGARAKLAVVTNCSDELGTAIARHLYPGFDVIVTAERAGHYKPRPEPYAMMLEELAVPPTRTLFVAGSASDVPGASALGMDVYWHNRIGRLPLDDTAPRFHERSLQPLLALV